MDEHSGVYECLFAFANGFSSYVLRENMCTFMPHMHGVMLVSVPSSVGNLYFLLFGQLQVPQHCIHGIVRCRL